MPVYTYECECKDKKGKPVRHHARRPIAERDDIVYCLTCHKNAKPVMPTGVTFRMG